MTRLAWILVSFAVLIGSPTPSGAAAWNVEPVAGGGPHLLPATESSVASPWSIEFGPDGDYYVLSVEKQQVYRVRTDGVLEMLLDSRFNWQSGVLSDPVDLDIGPDGNLYVLQQDGYFHRRDRKSGEVSTGAIPFSLEAPVNLYSGIAVDGTGRIYYAGRTFFPPAYVVWRYDPMDGTTHPVAGCLATCASAGTSGVPATGVRLGTTERIALDHAGNLYISEGSRIRRVDLATNIITTIAGSSTSGFSGDGGLAVDAMISAPRGLHATSSGTVLFADMGNHRVRRIDGATGLISTVSGNGLPAFAGDGDLALNASLDSPRDVALDTLGNTYIADRVNNRVRRVEGANGVIETVAGNGTKTFSGDGYPATRASLVRPSVAVNPAGDLFIADYGNHRIRKVDSQTGVIETIAGTGENTLGVEDDGVAAIDAVLPRPDKIQLDSAGNVYFIVAGNILRKIDATTDLISTIERVPGQSFAVTPEGGVFFSTNGQTIDWIDPVTGVSTPYAGTGHSYNGEGIPRLAAGVRAGPMAVAPDGSLIVVDSGYGIVRRVDALTGLVWTEAGLGPSYGVVPTADPLPPLTVGFLLQPSDIAVDPSGNVFIAGSLDALFRLDARLGMIQRIGGRDDIFTTTPSPLPPEFVPLVPGDLGSGGPGVIFVASGHRILRLNDGSQTPVADAGADLSVGCDSGTGGRVLLDGSASFDPDQAQGGESEISDYWWWTDFGQPGEEVIAKGKTVEVGFPVGVHLVTLQVFDRYGRTATDSLIVEVRPGEDSDGDGIPACMDNCTEVHNPEQMDGDANGLGDLCDPCFQASLEDPDADGVCSGIDLCPSVHDPLQHDDDGDGIGNDCDICPSTANPDQAESGFCMDVLSEERACIPAVADLGPPGRLGRIFLSHVHPIPPDRVIFTVYRSVCDGGDLFEFYVNDTLVSDFQLAPPCLCYGSETSRGTSDRDLLASTWKGRQENTLRAVKTGTEVRVAWIKARAEWGNFSQEACLYDRDGRNCTSGLGCFPTGDTNRELDESATLQDVAGELAEDYHSTFGPETVSATVDVRHLEPDTYNLCVSATDRGEQARLYAADADGALLDIDVFTGAVERVGTLPLIAYDIAFDPHRKTGIVLGEYASNGLIVDFDVADGTRKSRPRTTFSPLETIEFGHGDLYGSLFFKETYPPFTNLVQSASVYKIDSAGQFLSNVERIEERMVREMAFDENTGNLLVSVSRYTDQPGTELWQIDVPNSEHSAFGLTRLPQEAIEFGPDGLLYTITTPYQGTGELYRLEEDNPRLVADLGYEGVTMLTRKGPQGTARCVELELDGQETIAINASCGPPQAVITALPESFECESASGARMALDGSGSADPNSSDDDNDGIVDFEWFEDFGAGTQVLLGRGETLETTLPLGLHKITLRTTNRYGETDTDQVSVRVVDTVAPVLTLELAPITLWPPDHSLIDIEAAVQAGDACGSPAVVLASIASNEADDATGGGDGHTTGDIQGADYGAEDLGFQLRAERAGKGNGRTYTITYMATDRGGNSTSAVGLVSVPHDGE